MSSTTSFPTTLTPSYTASSSDSEMEMPSFEPFTPKSRSDDLLRTPLRKTEKRLSLRNVDSRSSKIQKVSSTDDVSSSPEVPGTPKGADKQCASTNAPKKLRRPARDCEEPAVSSTAFEEFLGLSCRFDDTTSPETPQKNVVPRAIVKPVRRYRNQGLDTEVSFLFRTRCAL